MYLHLGQETVVNTDTIIGVFDLDNCTISRHTKLFLTKAQKEGRVINVSMELPKSFIVCLEGKKEMVYLSQLSAATMVKRARGARVALGL